MSSVASNLTRGNRVHAVKQAIILRPLAAEARIQQTGIETDFSPTIIFGFPNQYHSTNATYSANRLHFTDGILSQQLTALLKNTKMAQWGRANRHQQPLTLRQQKANFRCCK
jgi:hypothetical protein